MKWTAGAAALILALLWLMSSPERRGWDWASNWAGQIAQPTKPKIVLGNQKLPPIEIPPPVSAPAPEPVPIPAPKPQPKAAPKAAAPRPVAKKPAAPIGPTDCQQIAVGINLIGRESMRREARARGYSSAQIAAAEKACGY